MDQSLQKDSKLLKSKDFDRLRSDADYVSIKNIYSFNKPNYLKKGRLGITVSRKAGCAVFRNAFKRAMRESFRRSDLRDLGLDIVVIAKPGMEKIFKNRGLSIFKEAERLFQKILLSHQ